ncbi:MAG: hypothetical protein JRI34_00880 [Deltaproteobacteria bacterium]|nr:hypothetical protein [Deltaproteobacteria bacterium]
MNRKKLQIIKKFPLHLAGFLAAILTAAIMQQLAFLVLPVIVYLTIKSWLENRRARRALVAELADRDPGDP